MDNITLTQCLLECTAELVAAVDKHDWHSAQIYATRILHLCRLYHSAQLPLGA